VGVDGNVARIGDNAEVGTVTGLVLGGPSWRSVNGARGDVVDTTGQVGVPVDQVNQPAHGDLLVIDGVRYSVKGPPSWTHDNTLTGTSRRYRWWLIAAAAN
jgi:hypothetical protein